MSYRGQSRGRRHRTMSRETMYLLGIADPPTLQDCADILKRYYPAERLPVLMYRYNPVTPPGQQWARYGRDAWLARNLSGDGVPEHMLLTRIAERRADEYWRDRPEMAGRAAA